MHFSHTGVHVCLHPAPRSEAEDIHPRPCRARHRNWLRPLQLDTRGTPPPMSVYASADLCPVSAIALATQPRRECPCLTENTTNPRAGRLAELPANQGAARPTDGPILVAALPHSMRPALLRASTSRCAPRSPPSHQPPHHLRTAAPSPSSRSGNSRTAFDYVAQRAELMAN